MSYSSCWVDPVCWLGTLLELQNACPHMASLCVSGFSLHDSWFLEMCVLRERKQKQPGPGRRNGTISPILLWMKAVHLPIFKGKGFFIASVKEFMINFNSSSTPKIKTITKHLALGLLTFEKIYFCGFTICYFHLRKEKKVRQHWLWVKRPCGVGSNTMASVVSTRGNGPGQLEDKCIIRLLLGKEVVYLQWFIHFEFSLPLLLNPYIISLEQI